MECNVSTSVDSAQNRFAFSWSSLSQFRSVYIGSEGIVYLILNILRVDVTLLSIFFKQNKVSNAALQPLG